MRLAGPREALLHTIIANNYGCTHFVVGRDHASPGTDAAGKSFYDSHAAQELTERHSEDIGVAIIPFENKNRPLDQIPEEEQNVSFSKSNIRERIRSERKIPELKMVKEVVAELKKRALCMKRLNKKIFPDSSVIYMKW